MGATQFSLLNWNHISLKQREVLTGGMLAAGQNPPLEHDGASPKHISHLREYSVVTNANNLSPTFSRRNFLEPVLV